MTMVISISFAFIHAGLNVSAFQPFRSEKRYFILFVIYFNFLIIRYIYNIDYNKRSLYTPHYPAETLKRETLKLNNIHVNK